MRNPQADAAIEIADLLFDYIDERISVINSGQSTRMSRDKGEKLKDQIRSRIARAMEQARRMD